MFGIEGALGIELALTPDAGDPLAAPIVDTLGGWPGRAVPALASAARDGDATTRARAVAWSTYAASVRANLFPGGTVAGGVEVTRRWPELLAALPAAATTPAVVAVECELLTRVVPQLRLARTSLGTGGTAVDPVVVDAALAAVDALERAATSREDRPTAGLCRRARIDLLHRAGRRDAAATSLATALDAADGDGPELGALHLLCGDHLLAPLSHPDAGDHVLVDSALETSALPWSVESREADPTACDTDAAAEAYDAAESAVTAGGGSTDAFAGVLALRRSSIARIRGDRDLAVRLADDAERAATTAADGWSARTAGVHGSLARIAAGQPTGAPGVPEEVGRWGAGEGSFSHAFGLGLLLGRAGRGWLVREGDAERAARCAELARRLFTALGAGTQASQSLADAAAALAAVGAARDGLARLERALDEHLGRTADPELGTDAWRRATSLAVRIHGLHLADADPVALRRSGDRLGQLATSGPEAEVDDGTLGPLRDLAREFHAATEVQALLAEGDAARDAGDDELARERHAAAAELAGTHGDHLGRAVALARLRRTAEAVRSYAAQQRADAEDVARRFEALRAELGTAADDVLEQLDQTGNALRREAAFHTRIGAAAEAADAFDRLDAHEPDWPQAEQRPWELLSDHGHVREQLGDLDRAATLHAAATAALDDRASRVTRDELRTTLHGGGGRTFARAARTELRRATAAGDPLGAHATAAFLLGERGRARALTHLLAAGTADPTTLEVDHPLRRWAAASARLSLSEQLLAAELGSPTADPGRADALRTRIVEQEEELTRRRDELRTLAPDVADVVTVPPPAGVDEVAARLPADGLLVSHLLVDDDLLTWAIGPDGLLAADRREVDARDLSRDLTAFVTGCASGGPWIDPARRVAELLLAPVRELLQDRRRLYLVPTGAGHGAPLQALPFGDGLLLEHVTVAVLPSATVLHHLRAPGGTSAPALVVGDPDGPVLRTPTGEVDAAPLPGARLEATAVARRFPGSRLLIGAAATLDAVTDASQGARMVHLAAHAAVAMDAPLATAVLLAHGQQLTVADLLGRRLVADLVVLSACDSGRGPVTGGEEVLGMTRALLAAGAAAAVVSLWPVDDRSTAVLMDRFADGLADGADPSAALQAAQRWFRGLDDDHRSRAFATLAAAGPTTSPSERGDDGARRGIARATVDPLPPAHPFHWAGFVHVGRHAAG